MKIKKTMAIKWVIRVMKGVVLILCLWVGLVVGSIIRVTITFGWDATDELLGLTSKMIEWKIIEPEKPEIIEEKEKKIIFVDDGILELIDKTIKWVIIGSRYPDIEIIKEKEKKIIFLDDGTLVINHKGIRQNGLTYKLPSLSFDSKKIVFSKSENVLHFKFEVWVMEIESGRKKRLLRNVNVNEKSPCFLPDGRFLLPGISILDIDKHKQERLTEKGTNLSLSPDGKNVVFEVKEKKLDSNNMYDRSNIYIVNIDDKKERQLTVTEDGWNVNPSFSPDGKEIVFESLNEVKKSRNICLMDIDGGNLRVIKDDVTGFLSSYPRFSPDGKKIIFLLKKEGNYDEYQICIMKKDGTNQKRLIELKNYTRQLREYPLCSYSFIYDKFIFLLKEADGFNLYTTNLDGTGKKKVIKMEELPYLFCLRYPAWYLK